MHQQRQDGFAIHEVVQVSLNRHSGRVSRSMFHNLPAVSERRTIRRQRLHKRFVPAEMNRFLTLFYGFIRFLQEILLDFTAAGEVYYNRFRMEQRAACRGAILHLFKFT